MDNRVLKVENLSIKFPGRNGLITVVDQVSLSVNAGKSLVIAGESGSGKSMICQALLGIVPGAGQVSGTQIDWRGKNLLGLDEAGWKSVRGSEIAMIFQDPTAALNPLITIGTQIIDVIRTHKRCSRSEAKDRAIKSLELAGFTEPKLQLGRYSSQLSGGMRQRVAIALALSCEPALIIADEATSNLDVSIQANIVTLLHELKEKLGLALIFVTHDLGLAAEIGGDLLVMYAGNMVEYGPVQSVLDNPSHPYTNGLLQSAPSLNSTRDNPLQPIPGQAPKPGTLGASAPFFARCPVAVDGVCDRKRPGWTDVNLQHQVACHRFELDKHGAKQ
ncbi:MAG: ABC transporter ATP-binding protein [Planktomarina sp.]|nr:ABC transporter ATP-binding protein [Planktomarina sp.]